ncbi:MAG: hypothetical protein D6743_19815, partial [Calditrichaeota bacterium]
MRHFSASTLNNIPVSFRRNLFDWQEITATQQGFLLNDQETAGFPSGVIFLNFFNLPPLDFLCTVRYFILMLRRCFEMFSSFPTLSFVRSGIALLSFLFVAGGFAAGRGQRVFVLQKNLPDRVVFSLVPPDVRVQRTVENGRVRQVVTVPGYGLTTQPGLPVLPQTAALVQVPPGAQVRVEILEDVFEDLDQVDVSPAPKVTLDSPHDTPVYQPFRDAAFYASNVFWPAEVAVAAGEGTLRGQRIARVQVNPVQFNPATRTLRVHRKLTVAVHFSRPFPRTAAQGDRGADRFARLAGRLLLNPHPSVKPATARVEEARTTDGFWYHPDYTYYKLFIETEGIYRISYSDLVAAGVQPETLELSRLKLFNRGVEVPIWLEGPATATFGPENAILFYADRHRGQGRFYDFYTDTNVYWLTADGGPGKRLRRMPDAVSPGSPARFYRERLHLEEEKVFHRANGSSAIDPDEGWIWRYFFPDAKGFIAFTVSGLVASAGPCSLTVRLHGTTRDPVNPDHHVQATVNNEVVGEAFFDDREELIWHLTFDSALLHGGKNLLVLHLLPDTGAEVNQIYLDWVEISYPRVHAARQGALKFPAAATPGLYEILGLQDDRPAVLDPAGGRIWFPTATRFSVLQVSSAGFDDGNFFRAEVDFQPVVSSERGHHLVRVDVQSGELETRTFDTYASSEAADEMAAYIEGLPAGTVVLAGIADEGSKSMTERAYRALESLGSAL